MRDWSPGGGGSASARRRKTACDSGHPASPRRAGGLDQPLDHPAIGGRLAGQEVLGHARGRARLLGEKLGGTAMTLRALCAGELRIDPVADERMHERQRPAGLEDPGRCQQIRRIGCLGFLQARESRRVVQIALLEHRQRSCQPAGVLRQSPEPEDDGATDRLHAASDTSARSTPPRVRVRGRACRG